MFNELENAGLVEQPEQIETPVEQKQPQQESKSDQNWRLMRDRAEAAERRAQELERMMQQNMSQNHSSQKIQLVDDDDDIDISDDSYIEGKQLKKYVKSLKNDLRLTKKQLEEVAAKTAIDQAEFRLKTEFSDFSNVVTKDNIEKLAMAKPALYRSIFANKDIYDQGYTAYEMIKAAGLADDNYQQQERRIEENRSKPRAAAAASPQVSETPLARAGDYDRRILTKERREQILRNVEEAKRNRV